MAKLLDQFRNGNYNVVQADDRRIILEDDLYGGELWQISAEAVQGTNDARLIISKLEPKEIS